MRACLAVSLLVALGIPVLPLAPDGQDSKADSAIQTYIRFRATVVNAKAIDEVTAFWGGPLMYEFNQMPDADKTATLEMVKRIESMTSDVKILKETATGAGVTLTLEGIGRDKKVMTGSVDLVKENGVWKLAAQEQWHPKGG
jgi:hypothetical protein